MKNNLPRNSRKSYIIKSDEKISFNIRSLTKRECVLQLSSQSTVLLAYRLKRYLVSDNMSWYDTHIIKRNRDMEWIRNLTIGHAHKGGKITASFLGHGMNVQGFKASSFKTVFFFFFF